jgi:hypothetical protein
MTQEEIMNLATELGTIMQALKDAEPADKAEVYRRIGLTLTYHPQENELQRKQDRIRSCTWERVRGAFAPKSQHAAPLLTSEFALDALAGVR